MPTYHEFSVNGRVCTTWRGKPVVSSDFEGAVCRLCVRASDRRSCSPADVIKFRVEAVTAEEKYIAA